MYPVFSPISSARDSLSVSAVDIRETVPDLPMATLLRECSSFAGSILFPVRIAAFFLLVAGALCVRVDAVLSVRLTCVPAAADDFRVLDAFKPSSYVFPLYGAVPFFLEPVRDSHISLAAPVSHSRRDSGLTLLLGSSSIPWSVYQE
eukprot:GHVT01012579.1.p3 GENE.GHVT01012579.1~~GHVT01012579.1.p3  ORF type:complete len:147 (+),score=12.90 GHVT01012579.1:1060-1500(+)